MLQKKVFGKIEEKGEENVGHQKIRIKDIAQMAGVSATTVSNVIHGRDSNVSAKTKKRIEDIMKEYGYIPSAGAIMLSGKASKVIAVVVESGAECSREEISDILKIAGKQLQLRKYYMLVHFACSAEAFLEFAAAWKLDGVIILWMPEEECRKIRVKCEVPVVNIKSSGEWIAEERHVGIWYRAGEEAAKYLLKNGRQRIWFLDGTDPGCGTEIWRGMEKSYARRGTELEKERYLEIPKDRELRKMYYKIWLARLAFSGEVLVFASGRQGAEAVGYLSDMGIKVPEEIEMIGVGGEEYAVLCRPQLTTIEIDREKMVIQMIESLFRKMSENPVEWKTEKIKVKTVVRESGICQI